MKKFLGPNWKAILYVQVFLTGTFYLFWSSDVRQNNELLRGKALEEGHSLLVIGRRYQNDLDKSFATADCQKFINTDLAISPKDPFSVPKF